MARKKRKDSLVVDYRFEPFDIPKQLLHQLRETPLYRMRVDLGELDPDGIGIYALYLGTNATPVYVGKTDRAAKVRRRLIEHAKKIDGRKNIDIADVRFRYLLMATKWLVRACEEALITHYKPIWQRSGIGSHVPGRGRPGVRGADRFTKLYPPKKM